ncbi:MAG: heavy metal translocating P-type ATPase [Pseudomonadota bacterium]
MSCCAAMTPDMMKDAARKSRAEELRLASHSPRPGVRMLRLAAPDLKCGGCVAGLERALAREEGVLTARANLTAKTIAVEWREEAVEAVDIAEAAERAGQRVFPLDDAGAEDAEARESRDLLTRMAVAGFASANIMLLSVAVWSGAEGATRDLMHWISAAIALPTVLYSGRPFFVSAWRGLKGWRLTMDAPISLAVILAACVSLSEAIRGGHETYFDAAVTLLFLLLVGRWLDKAMRAKARSAARALARLTPRGAWVETDEGRAYRPLEEIQPGDLVAVAAGERAAVDGVVRRGDGALDRSFLTGESAPVPVGPGDRVEAGALSLDATLVVETERVGEDTTIAEIGRLVSAAEERKSKLARLADQAARIYAPVVHGVALVVMLAWLALGADPREALLVAVALLIITCPCALGLAAPMAQAVASGTLYRRGVMLKDGAALERLARIRAVAFDKTGVLTMGRPRLAAPEGLNGAEIAALGALASESRHPLSRALTLWAAEQGGPQERIEAASETAGAGVSGLWRGAPIRLGSAAFIGPKAEAAEAALERDGADAASLAWAQIADKAPAPFRFADDIRPGARETVAGFARSGLACAMLSGDRPSAVNAVGAALGLADRRASLRPEDKIAAVEALRAEHGPVLMVGDGINDAPALAAADVSIAPASAADVGRAAADVVFTGAYLDASLEAWATARKTRAIILQNFGLAAAYNAVSIPLAALGYVGPLEAAIAMSTSSLLVTLNALRLSRAPRVPTTPERRADASAPSTPRAAPLPVSPQETAA